MASPSGRDKQRTWREGVAAVGRTCRDRGVELNERGRDLDCATLDCVGS